MNSTIIYARTSRGEREATSEAHELARDLLRILTVIDGNLSVEALRSQVDYLSSAEFEEALATLAAEDYIRDTEVSAPDSSAGQSTPNSNESLRKAQALRAKIRARREGGDRPAPVTDARDLQSDDQLRLADEQRSRLETAERNRQEVEETARREAEEEASRKAAEQAHQEAAEQARQAAAEQARQEAEEQARQELEARELREAEEEVRRVREEEAAGHARWMVEQKAWREAEEKLRREEEAAARGRANARTIAQDRVTASGILRKWGKPLALGFVALVVGSVAAVHLISFDGQIPQFEKALAGQFQQPVRIKSLRLALVPQNYVGLEGVSIGSDGQIKVSRIKLAGGIGNLFSDKKAFTSVEFDSPVVTEEGLGWILFGKPLARNMAFGQVSALNASLESKNISFPTFDAKLQSDGDGAWNAIAIESRDKNLTLELIPKGPSLQFDFKARSFKLPFGSALTLDELVASGIADRGGLTLAEFKGFAYGGTLDGNASLKWGANWTLGGELNAKQIDVARLVPELLAGGRLAGKVAYAMQAPDAIKLFSAPHLEGSFSIPWGTLLGTDLGSMLQGGGARGDTKFTDLAGSFVHDRGVTQLRQVSMSQGPMYAIGTLEVDADKNVRGRFAADLKLSAELRRANLTLSGTLKKLEWRR